MAEGSEQGSGEVRIVLSKGNKQLSIFQRLCKLLGQRNRAAVPTRPFDDSGSYGVRKTNDGFGSDSQQRSHEEASAQLHFGSVRIAPGGLAAGVE